MAGVVGESPILGNCIAVRCHASTQRRPWRGPGVGRSGPSLLASCQHAGLTCPVQMSGHEPEFGGDPRSLPRLGVLGERASVPPHHRRLISLVGIWRGWNLGRHQPARRAPSGQHVRATGGQREFGVEQQCGVQRKTGEGVGERTISGGSSVTHAVLISTTPNGIRSVISFRTVSKPGRPYHSTTACDSSAAPYGPLARTPATMWPAWSIAARNSEVSLGLRSDSRSSARSTPCLQ